MRLQRNFSEKFETQLRKKTAADILKFIQKKIGSDSASQKCDKAIQKLNEATRDVDSEEFGEFLDRITEIADQMTGKNQLVKTHFIEAAFRNNLTPSFENFCPIKIPTRNQSIRSQIY